jgi:Domain of unknown function (DUF4136)
MRTIPRLCIGLAVSVISIGSTVALAQDSYDYRRGANFSGIRTFAFKEGPPMAPDAYKTTTYDSPIQRERTQAAITSQLELRGLRRNDEHPDVYIVPRRTFKTDYTYYGPYGWGGPYAWGGYYGPGYAGWGGWGGGWYGGGYVYEELLGTLTVDVVDARNGELLWRGVETKRVHQTSKPAKRDKRVFDEVADVFKHFPSGALATTGVR